MAPKGPSALGFTPSLASRSWARSLTPFWGEVFMMRINGSLPTLFKECHLVDGKTGFAAHFFLFTPTGHG